MPLFGKSRDTGMMLHYLRELINNIIDHQIVYYKLDLDNTQTNFYGESTSKKYKSILMNAYVSRETQSTEINDNGIDRSRIVRVDMLRPDLKELGLFPEIGDIIMIDKDYYEINHIEDNVILFGRNNEYPYLEGDENFGGNLYVSVKAHYTRADKTGIIQR